MTNKQKLITKKKVKLTSVSKKKQQTNINKLKKN